MSSDDGGVGIVSSKAGRVRSARGRLAAAAVVARRGFRAGRFADDCFAGAALVVLATLVGLAALVTLVALGGLRGFAAARLDWRLAVGRLPTRRVDAVLRREPLDRAPRAPSRLAIFASFRTLTVWR
jgi:hypothetical protein